MLIAVFKSAFGKRKGLLTRASKMRIVKSLVSSVALYGVETWKLSLGDMNATLTL